MRLFIYLCICISISNAPIFRGAAGGVVGPVTGVMTGVVTNPVVTSPVVTSPAVTTVPMMASLAPGIAIGILKALFIGQHSHLLC